MEEKKRDKYIPRVKIATWADMCFIATFLFIIFCLIIFLAPIQIEVKILGKVIDEITIAQYWNLVNEKLKGFRFNLMIAGCGVFCFLLDLLLIRPFLNRYTKAGKIMRREEKEAWKKFLLEKDKEKNEK